MRPHARRSERVPSIRFQRGDYRLIQAFMLQEEYSFPKAVHVLLRKAFKGESVYLSEEDMTVADLKVRLRVLEGEVSALKKRVKK